MARKPVEFENFPANIDPGFGLFRAVVSHIIDADTVDVLIDCGFQQYRYTTIRVQNIDAPEIFSGTAEQKARGFAAKECLEKIAPVGTPCVIETGKDRQSFGRYSASILLQDGTDIASALVSAGHAEWSAW